MSQSMSGKARRVQVSGHRVILLDLRLLSQGAPNPEKMVLGHRVAEAHIGRLRSLRRWKLITADVARPDGRHEWVFTAVVERREPTRKLSNVLEMWDGVVKKMY